MRTHDSPEKLGIQEAWWRLGSTRPLFQGLRSWRAVNPGRLLCDGGKDRPTDWEQARAAGKAGHASKYDIPIPTRGSAGHLVGRAAADCITLSRATRQAREGHNMGTGIAGPIQPWSHVRGRRWIMDGEKLRQRATIAGVTPSQVSVWGKSRSVRESMTFLIGNEPILEQSFPFVLCRIHAGQCSTLIVRPTSQVAQSCTTASGTG
ncbi:uncharacterized protein B0H64DRAFT_19759 [Chaetomium fimeti]|uniref:Uncharacterized protein n=1 Tax=Chaetomium fimeti TaxID=1854472 RepID=A0AAE0HQ00_9PEZI|nr:hypothetical protein B0H64DRAFT_19759 [Chaetomium fimeti]